MEEIRRQVSRVRRRLMLQQFVSAAAWCLFFAFLAAAVALAIPKIWVVNVDPQVWNWRWIGGSAAAGLLAAAGYTLWKRQDIVQAAIEIDHRYGLKERVSSSLSLAEPDRETPAGRALLNDASRRVAEIDLSEKFRFSPQATALLPLAPLLAMAAIVLFAPNAIAKQRTAEANAKQETKEQIKKSTEQLKKKIEQQRKQAEEKDLKDAEAAFRKLQQGVDKLQSKDAADRKEALVELNDLAKQLKKRRDQLGGADKLRKQMGRLNNINRGPAEKVSKALQQGDFGKALEEMKNLQEKLEKGELGEEEKKKLAEQLQKMQEQVENLVQEQEQAKQDLERMIQEKLDAGDLAGASKLQQQLDQLKAQDGQMARMQQMAQQMGDAAKALQNGDQQNAAQQMAQLAEQLDQMQNEMDELEMIGDVLDQVADAKAAMNCKACQGAGCAACQGGMGMFGMQGQGQRGGFGMGEGRGQGDRPEERTDSNFYDSKVGAKPKPGEAIRTGDAGGPNRAGRTMQEVRSEIAESLSAPSDPLTNQRLSRDEKEHAKQYFERMREGS